MTPKGDAIHEGVWSSSTCNVSGRASFSQQLSNLSGLFIEFVFVFLAFL
jgi:hypothetical protein